MLMYGIAFETAICAAGWECRSVRSGDQAGDQQNPTTSPCLIPLILILLAVASMWRSRLAQTSFPRSDYCQSTSIATSRARL